MDDKRIKCVQCGQDFVWTAGEQEFYVKMGHTEPKRCKACREARKAERDAKGPRPQGGGR